MTPGKIAAILIAMGAVSGCALLQPLPYPVQEQIKWDNATGGDITRRPTSVRIEHFDASGPYRPF